MRFVDLLFVVLVMGFQISFAQDIQNKIDQVYPNSIEPGVSVALKNGEEIQYFAKGLMHLDSKNVIDSLSHFRMASVSKQFTAMAIYQLINSGQLSFDTKVSLILPELAPSAQYITLENLINHSSGILDYESMIEAGRKTVLSDADVLQYVSQVDSLCFQPGSKFRYSNTAYCLMALIVERVTKKDYPDAVRTLIFEPLGLQNASVYPTIDSSRRAYGYHPEGVDFRFADQSLTSSTKGDGGVYISSTEYNRWLDQTNPLFSETYWQDLDTYKILVKDGIYYSLGWFVMYDANNEPLLFHSGESTGFHNIVLFIPRRNQAVTIFSNRDDLKISNLFDDILFESAKGKLPESLFLWMNKVYMNE